MLHINSRSVDIHPPSPLLCYQHNTSSILENKPSGELKRNALVCDAAAVRCPLLQIGLIMRKKWGKHWINITWIICKSMVGHQANE